MKDLIFWLAFIVVILLTGWAMGRAFDKMADEPIKGLEYQMERTK